VIFRVIPWPPRAQSSPKKLRVLRGFVLNPTRAIHFANLAPLRETPDARLFRPPHVARIDYDYEHRCAEHEHDPSPFP
jgi:hypothetical protein